MGLNSVLFVLQDGMTSLYLAINYGHLEVEAKLLDHEPDKQEKDEVRKVLLFTNHVQNKVLFENVVIIMLASDLHAMSD